jgi:hypothetical protein
MCFFADYANVNGFGGKVLIFWGFFVVLCVVANRVIKIDYALNIKYSDFLLF